MNIEQRTPTPEYPYARRSAITVCLVATFAIAVMVAPSAHAGEIDAMVYTKKDDGSRGKRVYRDSFLSNATEEHSASFSACGDALFGYRDKVNKLLSYHRPGYIVIFYRSTIDPVTKNSRRAEVCRLDESS